MPAQRAARVVSELQSEGTPLRAAHDKHSFKSDSVFYGVTVPRIRIIVRTNVSDLCAQSNLSSVLQLAQALWKDGAHESRLAATFAVCECEAFYDDRVWKLGATWLSDIDNRALCDNIGPGMLAPFVRSHRERHRSRRQEVVRWTRSENPWIRRCALLATLGAVRDDRDWELLSRVAPPLVQDSDYNVQKGLGWMLRECAHHNPREVITFIQEHRDQMRRSTITSAISRLPATLQRAARSRPHAVRRAPRR